jgi:tetratricopeptide (TPR) repeat protein
MRRRFSSGSNLAAIAIIAAVATMVGYANWRERRSARSGAAAPLFGRRNAATSRADLERRIREMEAVVAAHPDDVVSANVLADALLRQTRVTGNAGLARRAEQVLTSALIADPGSYDANRTLGALYLSEHRFREAIRVAERNRDARPYDPVNYGVIGDGHLELGEYDEAFDAFDRMIQIRPGASAYARVAYSRELQGDLDGALAAMQMAADATAAEDLEGLAWARAQTGELYIQLGRLGEAKAQFVAASEAFPGHPFAVVGYAKAIDAEGDLQGALNLLENLADRAPSPDLAARIGDLLNRLGRADEAREQYAVAEVAWRSDVSEPKAFARFLAVHGKAEEAVKVAEAAIRERRDIFTQDALAWAYFKAGRVSEANAAIALALRTGSRDREIRSHADAIRAEVMRMASR